MLVVGVWKEATRFSLVGLLSLFSVVTGQAWIRGLEISCGCFELPWVNPDLLHFFESPPVATIRNLIWLSACLWLLKRDLGAQRGPN